ncbi:MAG: nickel-responsive transcriptional regulator NikR [Candidatus Sumerlaeota bacterium]|nr:nickel-responsive transcriptional regulator NikR [Candidatus Sumerlaeota bacterium]
MAHTVRFGVSLDGALLKRFERRIRREGYDNRSEAIRDLIRESLVAEQWGENDNVVGAITLVYDHHVRELSERLMHIQHHHVGEIVSTLHVHLDRDHCMETLVVRAKAARARHLADSLRALRGIKHVALAMTASARTLP